MPCYCAKMKRAAAIRRADEESDTLLTERPVVNVCTQDEADYWAGINRVVDEPSEPLGGIPDEDEF